MIHDYLNHLHALVVEVMAPHAGEGAQGPSSSAQPPAGLSGWHRATLLLTEAHAGDVCGGGCKVLQDERDHPSRRM